MPSVLLLGATSDMATALARKFASTGHDVQLAARNAHRLEPLRSDLSIRYGITATLLEFDARAFNQHKSFWDGLAVKPDITICVFGYMAEEADAETDWAVCLNTLEVNYIGAISILNIVANDYIALGKGTIVGISSVAGERGRQSNYIYGSSKAGFTAYLSGLRNRLFHHNLHVLSVLPGFVYTRMTEDLTLPPKLTATPEQVADAVAKAVEKKKNVLYVKWFWRWIMLIIKIIPESIFKKLKL